MDQCRIDVTLDSTAGRLEAVSEMTLTLRDFAPGMAVPRPRFVLHPDLGIDSITSSGGAALKFQRLADENPAPTSTSAPDDDAHPPRFEPARYELDWSPGETGKGAVLIHYGGRLQQDIAAGEKAGEIHNFQMRAHIGPEGIYLGENGFWYPQLTDDSASDANAETRLFSFELTAGDTNGMILVACGNPGENGSGATPEGKSTWTSPFPMQGLALVGGMHEVRSRKVAGVRINVHVSKDHAEKAEAILTAVESYLRLYEPLLGPYPYRDFTVVENFFSSGFAFPGFTVLASAVISMGPGGLRPGYLDHEMLHNWWGNGVFVSSLDGNWCECLTTYCANYMRPVLEGDDEAARKFRRSVCYGMSRMPVEKDRPLNRYDRDDGPSRFVGYDKGAMVFAMLADRIGQDSMWRALRRIRDQRLGKPTGWKDIREACESVTDSELEPFFSTWVEGTTLPDIAIEAAEYVSSAGRLELAIVQRGDRPFDLEIPVRLVYAHRSLIHRIRLNRNSHVELIPSSSPPKYVELDPDYRLLRRVPLDEVLPTISGIGKSRPLLIVREPQDWPEYEDVANQIRERYKGDDAAEVREIIPSELKPEDLQRGHVLAIGRACTNPLLADALSKEAAIAFDDNSFQLEGVEHERPGEAVLCCVRNPHVAGGVICIYRGNSEAALAKASLITFYGGNSLVLFEDGTPKERRDFERPPRVDVELRD